MTPLEVVIGCGLIGLAAMVLVWLWHEAIKAYWK